jgi:hypothetical protein
MQKVIFMLDSRYHRPIYTTSLAIAVSISQKVLHSGLMKVCTRTLRPE